MADSTIHPAGSVPKYERAQNAKTGSRVTKYGARMFQVITGILATPAEMLTGVGRLALSCAAAAGGSLILLGLKAAKKISPGNIKKIEIAEKAVGGFLSPIPRQVRIALLQLIPIFGPQLVNQYQETGSLKGFIDAPAIGGLLGKMGLDVAQVVYGSSYRKDLKMSSERVQKYYKENNFGGAPYQDTDYLKLKKPTVEDAKTMWEKAPDAQQKQALFVRIPVESKGGAKRTHDGTLLLCVKDGKRRLDAPTVIMYHGNGQHRDGFLKLTNEEIQGYLQQGYNVLLSSYAGDCVVQGDGRGYKEVSTKCTETLMREDAAADLNFLKKFGVTDIGIIGYSLGGAQAMNCAEAVGEGGPNVIFMLLNKTFTNAVDVVERAAKNATKSSILARVAKSFAQRFFLEEARAEEKGGKEPTRLTFLDNKAKLEELVSKPQFEWTKFVFRAGGKDALMGDMTSKGVNFSVDLRNALPEGRGQLEWDKDLTHEYW